MMSEPSSTVPGPATGGASPWLFFLVVFVLSVPFYVLGAVSGRLPIATFLPVSALMTFVPAMAALGLVYRRQGVADAVRFLGRAFDYRNIKSPGWVIAALLIMPLVFLVEFAVLRLEGRDLPAVQLFSVVKMVGFALMFFVGAIGEELGWQGYAFAGLKAGRSSLEAALVIGAIWALWHVIPFAEMGRSADWIIWQCLGAVALRIIIVWLSVKAGQSLFVAVLFHMMINLPWGIFPAFEAYFDPFVLFVILAVMAGMIAVLWKSGRSRGSHPTA